MLSTQSLLTSYCVLVRTAVPVQVLRQLGLIALNSKDNSVRLKFE